MYDWWLRQMRTKISVGTRYHAVFNLAIYAKKCNVDYEELKKDALSFLEFYDRMTNDRDNPFTMKDIDAALLGYDEKFLKYPKWAVELNTKVNMSNNNRHYQKRSVHLLEAREKCNKKFPNGS